MEQSSSKTYADVMVVVVVVPVHSVETGNGDVGRSCYHYQRSGIDDSVVDDPTSIPADGNCSRCCCFCCGSTPQLHVSMKTRRERNHVHSRTLRNHRLPELCANVGWLRYPCFNVCV